MRWHLDRNARLGMLLIALTVWQLVFQILLAVPDASWWITVDVAISAVLLAVGIGLVRGWRVAKFLAAVACAFVGLDSVWTLFGMLRGLGADDVTPYVVLALATAVAFTAMTVWLCFAMTSSLFGRPVRARAFTVRLVGVALLLTAIEHLWGFVQMLDQMRETGAGDLADAMGLSHMGSGSVSLTTVGMSLVGFPVWPVWHGLLALIAAALAIGNRAAQRAAASALVVLFGVLVVLALVWSVMASAADGAMVVVTVGATGILVYLAWWFRVEVSVKDSAAAGM